LSYSPVDLIGLNATGGQTGVQSNWQQKGNYDYSANVYGTVTPDSVRLALVDHSSANATMTAFPTLLQPGNYYTVIVDGSGAMKHQLLDEGAAVLSTNAMVSTFVNLLNTTVSVTRLAASDNSSTYALITSALPSLSLFARDVCFNDATYLFQGSMGNVSQQLNVDYYQSWQYKGVVAILQNWDANSGPNVAYFVAYFPLAFRFVTAIAQDTAAGGVGDDGWTLVLNPSDDRPIVMSVPLVGVTPFIASTNFELFFTPNLNVALFAVATADFAQLDNGSFVDNSDGSEAKLVVSWTATTSSAIDKNNYNNNFYNHVFLYGTVSSVKATMFVQGGYQVPNWQEQAFFTG
jgi:hypothetical protein